MTRHIFTLLFLAMSASLFAEAPLTQAQVLVARQARDLNKIGRNGDAIEKLEEYLKESEPHSELYHLLGILHSDAGKEDLAEKSFRKGLHLNPDNHALRRNLGLLLYRQKEYLRAGKELATALNDLRPNPHDLLQLGSCHLGADMPGAAVQAFSWGVSIAPDNIELRKGLANALIKTGRHKEATVHLKEALSLNGEDRELWRSLSSTAYLAGDRELAMDALESVRIQGMADSTDYQRLARLYAMSDMPEQAVEYFDKAGTDDPNIGIMAARCLVQAGLYEDALTRLPGSTDAGKEVLRLRAESLTRLERWNEAYETLNLLSGIDAWGGRCEWMKGYCQYKLGHNEEARRHFLAARVFPDWRLESDRQIIRIDLELNLIEEAKSRLKTALKNYPDDPWLGQMKQSLLQNNL